jgi:hypothetical protein
VTRVRVHLLLIVSVNNVCIQPSLEFVFVHFVDFSLFFELSQVNWNFILSVEGEIEFIKWDRLCM